MQRLATMAAATALVAVAPPATAQDYPNRSVRIIVPVAAGGSPDVLARILGDKLREKYSQPFVVDNRAGAGQMIGADLAAKSAPDGYTLFLSTATYTSSAASQPKLPFDPVRDLTGVTMVGVGPFLLVVHPSVPVRSVKELIALAKRQPGQLNYGSAGTGSIIHFAAEEFAASSGIRIVHVPYKSAAPAVAATVAGEVPFVFMSMPSVMPQVKNNRLRAIAVSTKERSPFAPDLPTVSEAGVPGFDASQWWGMFAPAKVPGDVIAKLNAEVNRLLALDDMKAKLATEGAQPVLMSPEAFTKFVHAEIAKWRKVVAERNIVIK
jgi:tripartite-type tricarboxylate transporter receptor subunit TctC